ncbi:MAG: AAA family ATPase [Acidimicrobiia bacterium]
MPESEKSFGDSFLGITDMLQEAKEPTLWVVKDFIHEEATVELHGPEHVGKTYVVLDLGLHIASPQHDSYHGFAIPKTRPVVYLASEGRKTMTKRLQSWLDFHGIDTPDFSPPTYEDLMSAEVGQVTVPIEHDRNVAAFYRFDLDGFYLDAKSTESRRMVADLGRRLHAYGALHGASPVLIVDVVSDFAPSVDENSREFGHALSMLKASDLGIAATILVHHEGHTAHGRGRGHSSQQGMIDIRIPIEIKTDNFDSPTISYIRVSQPKNRDEDKTPPFILVLRKPNEFSKPVIIGRPEGAGVEALLLKTWSGAFNGQDLTELDRAILVVVLDAGENAEVTLTELIESTNRKKSTVASSRDKLIDKAYLVKGKTRGAVRITESGLNIIEDPA